MPYELFAGDCRTVLPTLPPDHVQTVITSPPYFRQRTNAESGELGRIDLPDYVENLVGIFREVRRVLKPDGTLWLNLGDTYARKQLVGVPWSVANALKSDGWILRSEIIWHKPNAMPCSVRDRPGYAHETIFLFSKKSRYYYDRDAIREVAKRKTPTRWIPRPGVDNNGGAQGTGGIFTPNGYRHKRSVWTVATVPSRCPHFSTFPKRLVEPCVLAGCPVGGRVLDPFGGLMTVGLVCADHGRDFVGIELNSHYLAMGRDRLNRGFPAPCMPAHIA